LPKIEQERQAANCNQLRSGFESCSFLPEELNRCAVEKKIGAKRRFFIEPHSIWCYSASVAKFWQLAREVPRLKPHRIIFSVRTATLFFMRQSKIE
jgi:hypothetical protein